MVSPWLAAAVVLALSWRTAEACMCDPKLMHPQSQFCNSDFVMVGRVQRIFKGNQDYHVYKIKIRNVFKSSPKAEVALKSGRLYTAPYESLCGITLQPRETYVISGFVSHLQAHVNLCKYVSKWKDVTPRQRKGFRLLYKQGCTCKVHTYVSLARRRPQSRNTCQAAMDDCYSKHGICLHDRHGRCNWTRAPRLTRCLQAPRFNGTNT